MENNSKLGTWRVLTGCRKPNGQSLQNILKDKNMNLNEFELEFREKCRMESVIIKKFEYNPDKELLKIELKYDFDSMPIPNKFEIERIDFPDKYVIGTIQKKNFKQFIDTFYV